MVVAVAMAKATTMVAIETIAKAIALVVVKAMAKVVVAISMIIVITQVSYF